MVNSEVRRVYWDVLCRIVEKAKLPPRVVPVLQREFLENYQNLSSKCQFVKTNDSSINRVNQFYRDIWSSPSEKYKCKIEEWAMKKRKNPTDGPPRGADLEILAVAVDLSKGDSEVLTFDNDFIVFSDFIKSDLNVLITSGFELKL
ncbi:MAG: hypothetical protein ABC611_08150 [Candidatus Methanosuratincola petrocarbonis]